MQPNYTGIISGEFVDWEHPPWANEHDPDITKEDIENFVTGHHERLTSAQVAFLYERQEDPFMTEWDRQHAHYIFVAPMDFFGLLFIYFPVSMTFEESYQYIRSKIGPRPIYDVNLWEVLDALPITEDKGVFV